MKLDDVVMRVAGLASTVDTRVFTGSCSFPQARYEFEASCNQDGMQPPQYVEQAPDGVDYQFNDFAAQVHYMMHPDGLYVDEEITLKFGNKPCSVNDMSAGMVFGAIDLKGFTATPIPFKTGLDGTANTIDLNNPQDCSRYAEGWVLGNGEYGMLVMRVPSGDPLTCFVPLAVKERDGRMLVQVGSIGPDGDSHFSRNPFFDTEFTNETITLPRTRFVFFQGNWKTGYEVFRQMVELSLERCRERRRTPCPITYNTFHDFGPSYDHTKLAQMMPQIASMGIGMLHLDPGWETVWGSNEWNDEQMGTPESYIREAGEHGLQVGCWTSVHTTDPDVHNGYYTLNSEGEKYLAEDFTRFNPASVRLWGVCPASGWHGEALGHLSRLGRAGLRFLNSDFHDWPWSAESCHSKDHAHNQQLTRVQWALALNDFYAALHRQCPEMVIEMHDHVESGAYQTPVWYLYDRPDSYDEKWAYEFMWTTYQDLIDHKLFALYYLRLAEPIPLYLHINASTDNENALAFWYVASCVTHIGVGAILRSNEDQRRAYQRAFGEYNAHLEAFTLGKFHGIDELTHVHVYPDRMRAVILAFNLADQPVERELVLTPDNWEMSKGAVKATGADTVQINSSVVVRIGPRSVTLVDLSIKEAGS